MPPFDALSLEPSVAGQVGAWLATYLAHGVALFLAAAIGARLVRNARVREQLWRAALFGPLVTASLQLGAGLAPLGGRWDLSLDVDTAAVTAEPEAGIPVGPAELIVLSPEQLAHLHRNAEFGMAVAQDDAGAEAAPATAEVRRRWTAIATGLLAAGIAALMIRALLEALRVQRLGRGVVLTRGPIFEAANRFAKRAGILRRVRVEVTERGTSPYATGVLRPRIVVPERAMAELDDAALRAMIAHELGHVARYDPLWTAAVRSVSALFFFQPLNWLIAQRLDECAEFCCDEFAVESTGDEVALARCLASVAGWIVGPNGARPACAMAHKRSPLGQRVERILETHGEARRRHVGARLVGALAIGATAMAAPGFAIAMDDEVHPEWRHDEHGHEAAADVGFPAATFGAVTRTAARPPAHAPRPTPAATFAGFTRPAAGAPAHDPLLSLAEGLQSALAEVDAELGALLALAAERELSEETNRRLQILTQRSTRMRAIVAAFSDQVRARARSRSGR